MPEGLGARLPPLGVRQSSHTAGAASLKLHLHGSFGWGERRKKTSLDFISISIFQLNARESKSITLVVRVCGVFNHLPFPLNTQTRDGLWKKEA